jgi:general secretion pathway protein B
MSFILDALRKSETERQRQAMPGLADAGYRPPAPRRGFWIPVLITVLAANVVLLGAFWWQGRPSVPVTTTVPGPPASPPAAARQASGGSSLATAAGVAPLTDLATEEANGLRADGDGFTEILEPPLDSGALPAPVADGSGGPSPPSNEAPASDAALPSAAALIARGALNMPALHLDMHVFSAKPAERFVFINMRKYAEGGALPEGPQIEEITAEGVILRHNGSRFLLTRE